MGWALGILAGTTLIVAPWVSVIADHNSHLGYSGAMVLNACVLAFGAFVAWARPR